MQRAARRGKRRQEKETNYAASGAAGKTSTTEGNERCSEPHGQEGIDVRNIVAIWWAA
jgi:hypothetical protein